jgi:uncharacterized protein DUF4349
MTRWLPRPRRPLTRLAVLLGFTLLAGLLAAACVTQTGTPGLLRGFGATAPAVQPQLAPAPNVGAPRAAQTTSPPPQSGATTSDAAQSTPLSSLDRMLVRSAKLSVQVGDVEGALARVREIAQAGGGFLSASNTRLERTNGQDRMLADLTIQVRSDALDNSLQALRGLGQVESETSNSQDVTDEYVDLDANLRNLQASEAAIVRLMDRAQRIEDILSLQRELTNVRGQIERIQGRKTYLERRTDMASINLSLHLPAADASAPGWNPLAIAARGWNASLAVLRGAAELLIVVVAFSWWLVPLAAAGAYVWTHRRHAPVVAGGAPADTR